MAAPASRVRTLRPAEAAWIAAVPCALLTVAAIVLLGPPLGHAFLGPGSEAFWSRADNLPEPAEHGRYLIALLGPALLAAAVLAAVRRRTALRPNAVRVLVGASQTAAFGFLVVCLAAQEHVVLSADDARFWDPVRYFTRSTLIAAGVLPLLLLALVRTRGVAAWVGRAARETRPRRIAGLLLAAVFTAVWLLTVVDLDSSLGTTNPAVAGNLLWSMSETFAILDGRTPLVNFHAQYGQLWPYLAAGAMAATSAAVGAYTIVMAAVSGLTLLALYATLRRIVHSSLAALALFLPVLASGFFMELGPAENRYGPGNLFSVWPIRYGGPYLLAWLVARHLDRAAPRRARVLFLVAGVVVLNNPEFGLAALAATVVALACIDPPRSRRAAARLLGLAAAGLLGAAALVAVLTLVRSGQLPRFGLLFEFSRLYAVGGWAMLPMPNIGLYLALYVTFAAAIVVAVVRVASRRESAVLSGMLAWSGTFGLIAGGYFAGRSHPEVLIDLFSVWAFSLALLLVVVLRGLAARGWRRPSPAELAVLFGFGLATCSLAQLPTPWSQLSRIRHRAPTAIFKQAAAAQFVARGTRRGEHVEILIPLGFRIAYDLGLVNVSPYSSIESMPTRQQLAAAIDALRRAHGDKVFVSNTFTFPEELRAIERAGFSVRRSGEELVELVDRLGGLARGVGRVR